MNERARVPQRQQQGLQRNTEPVVLSSRRIMALRIAWKVLEVRFEGENGRRRTKRPLQA